MSQAFDWQLQPACGDKPDLIMIFTCTIDDQPMVVHSTVSANRPDADYKSSVNPRCAKTLIGSQFRQQSVVAIVVTCSSHGRSNRTHVSCSHRSRQKSLTGVVAHAGGPWISW